MSILDKPILRTWMQRGKTGENKKARPEKNVEIVGCVMMLTQI